MLKEAQLKEFARVCEQIGKLTAERDAAMVPYIEALRTLHEQREALGAVIGGPPAPNGAPVPEPAPSPDRRPAMMPNRFHPPLGTRQSDVVLTLFTDPEREYTPGELAPRWHQKGLPHDNIYAALQAAVRAKKLIKVRTGVYRLAAAERIARE